MNAMLQRDTDTAAGLQKDQPHYEPLEEEIEPLRTEHSTNLTEARRLEKTVLAADRDDATGQKKGARKELRDLGERLAGALQGFAASKANSDPDLAGRVRFTRSDLSQADDATFATIMAALLAEAAKVPAAALAKREFTADDLKNANALLLRFTNKKSRQRTSAVDGATDRKRLVALLRRNADLIKQMRTQLKAYKNSPTKHDVWLRFVGYTMIVDRSGGGGAKGATPTPTV